MEAEVGNAVVSGGASKVAEILFDPIQREICYVFKYKSYVEKLRSQLGDLNNRKQRLEQTVENAKRQGDKIFDDVEQHLMKMNELIARAEKLVEEEEDKAKNKRCFIGLCPNFMSRHKLSKEAVNATKDAENLLREGYFKLDTAVSYCPAPERIEIMNVTRGYQQFDSRMKVFNNIMEALQDSNVDMIGVYGMGGVGKTTLAKQVEKKVVEDKLFDEVVMAEVTQTPDLKTIQDKIAYDLGFTFLQHENEFARVGRLHRRLKEKRVLVILDNIWEKLELEAVGIPFGNDEKEGKDVQRRCTVLLTSRSQHVLRNDMNSQKNFPIEVLSNEEAMILFWKTLDGHSTERSNFQLLAHEIVRKCEGLPVAIKTIAGSLKNKTIEVWKDALNRLRNSDARHVPEMEANVYSAIKLSYNILVNEEAKSLFRLCALQNDGSRILINDLMTYVMGSGWFKNVCGLEEVRNRVHALIDNLKSSCLLLDGDNEHVKMHDIIHAVGISIAAEEHMFKIQNVRDLKEELENVIPKDPIAISLTCRGIQELPQRFECPKLNLFLFFANYRSSLQIQNFFSDGMKEFRVLNLTQIVFPPSLESLACLINLRTLSLINCHSLVDVALVGELKKLQILSFQGSDIEQLPLKIGQLTQLKKLDLSNCSRLKVIAPNVISKLSQLEELYMVNSFTKWEKGEGGSNASLVELSALSQLTTLEINIPDVKIVPPDLVSVELERFKIFLGYKWQWINVYSEAETSRTLKFSGLVKNCHLGEGMKMLLKRTEDLYLDKLNDFCHVVNELDAGEGFPQLKYLSLKNSPEILYILTQGCCNAFPLLESVSLHNLINLEKICHGQLAEDQSFSKLRMVKVEECHELKHLFSFSMAKNLLHLQEIEVTNCKGLKLIVGEERESYIVCENEGINFAQLHSLALTGLPQLRCSGFNLEISQRLSTTASSASNKIVAEDDLQDFVTVLFNNKVTFPTLETLILSSLNIEKIWLDQFSTCQNLTKLEVYGCDYLKFLFSYSMVHSFVQLQNLVIRGCKSMEWVINTNGLRRDEEQMIGVMVFPKLKSLNLSNLPRLTRFVSMSSSEEKTQSLFNEKVAFPNLKNLKVSMCNELRNLATLSTVGSLVKLARIEINSCKMIEEIVQHVGEVKVDPIVFSQLVYLKLDNLPRLEHFLGGNYTLEFPYLEQMVVSGCLNMKIFSQGVLRTPKLQKVKLTKYGPNEERWEGSLNSTIQKMFEEMAGIYGLRNLTLSQVPRVKKIWHSQAIPVSNFCNLMFLVVDDCQLMLSAIPAKLLRYLKNLSSLTVKNCDSVEEVFHMEELNSDEHSVQLFPKLWRLYLIDLPKLKRFCNFSRSIIELPYLEYLTIANCSNIETFISNSTDDQPLFNEKVTFHNLSQLKLSKLPKLLHLCKENSSPIHDFQNLETCSKLEKVVPSWVSFQNLIKMEVSKCDGLTNLMALSTAKSLMKLKRMKITNCKMIEEIIHVREEVKKDCIVFCQVEYLELSCLPSLTGFFLGNYTLEFPSLEQVIVKECPKMEIFSRGVLSTPKLERLQLTEIEEEEIVKEDEWLWEGSLNSTIQKLFEEKAAHYLNIKFIELDLSNCC